MRRFLKVQTDVFESVIAALIDDNVLDKEIEAGAQDAFMAGRDVVRLKFDADVDAAGVVSGETILPEVVAWCDYRQGPAKRWRDVPWVAYAHDVSTEEREKLENPDFKVDGEKKDQPKDEKVWEIWCRETRRVYFVVEETAKVLNIVEDPLQLDGFFPQGAPVQPITATKNMTPVCPYTIYKALADELDVATKRINKIMRSLKVRGVIAGDATLQDLLSEAGDMELVPVPNLEQFAALGGLEKAISWFPADMAIAVLRELYLEREQTKQAIYEITGISDIVRGQGAASETATAQQIKTQWGSLRVKKMQRAIERQVRDLFVIMAEIIAKHFTDNTIMRMAGMQLEPAVLQGIRQWDRFKIDVESDSTIRADATHNRQEMGEFLNGTGAFFTAMAPIAQQAPETVASLAKMYAAFARQYNLGKEAETALDEFIAMADRAAQQPPQPSPEQIKAEAEMKMEEARFGLDREKLQLDAAKFDLDRRRAQAELGLKAGELELKEAVAEVDAAKKFEEQPQRQEVN